MNDVVVGSLCTGVGGLDLGVHAAYGGRTRLAWYAETNPDASTVLAARIPGVVNLGDVTAGDWAAVQRVDVLTAGFPCQPVSTAGQQKGDADERWLWDDVRRCYRVLRPQELVFENVRGLISIRKGALFAKICADLREDGYAVRWATAGACAIGGCHHRHRVFIVARYAWQLDPPAAQQIRIAECGARKGKARALLPTPTASRYGNNQGGQYPGGPVRHSPGQAHLLLPTPTTSDGMGGPGSFPGRMGGDNLRTVAAAELPGDAGLLPTPRATDTGTPGRRASDGFRPPLSQVIAEVGNSADELLPTLATGTDPSALLPTPTVVDAHAGVQNIAPGERGKSGYGPMLRDIAPALTGDDPSALLPTPRHSDAENGSPNQHGSRPGDLMLPSAVIGARYGRYAAAVTLWEHVSGRPAPLPTVANSKGQWRLNPELPEWMMGLPRGWITALIGRSAALRCAGNGVVPQVVATVYPLITAGWRYLQGGEVCPDPIGPAPHAPATGGPAARPGRRRARPAEQLTLC